MNRGETSAVAQPDPTVSERSSAPRLPASWTWAPQLAVAAVLALVLSVFFWRLTIEHRVLSPADWIYTVHPWAAQVPPRFVGPSNANQGDDGFLSCPRRSALVRGAPGASWWQADFPGGGPSTFSTDFVGPVFCPPAWAYHILPFEIANGVFHAAVLLVAGISMYLLLWQLRLPRP